MFGTDLNDYGTIKVSVKITPDNIWLDVSAANRAELIHTICCKLHEEGKTNDFNALYADVIRRERLVSTFAGQDTAIPHVITPHINEPVLRFVRVSDPDFTWHGDSEKVRFVFFCAVPQSPELTSMREQQSEVFAGIAQLIHTPEITNRWKLTDSTQVICNDLNRSFN